ncbi:unnamed protein product [Darwinula stevensoni]|uniref:FLYWCH-type domain-containing protein n=1 Tax=Darwinula stevensoni TaxID=69355 RepID=A0A7R8XE34_9CRUS|nr:unnamed protein product [Darwinula stevensoni]CAG0895419.1 unnamed protein product [Darwinula stevensoni]
MGFLDRINLTITIAVMSVRILEGLRGGRNLLHEGYLFRLNRRQGETSHWKCHNSRCNATVTITEDVLLKASFGKHAHEEPKGNVHRLRFASRLRERVKRDQLTPIPALYREEFLAMRAEHPDKEEWLQSYETVKSTLYQIRSSTFPKMPRSRAELQIPPNYLLTIAHHRPFLLRDEGGGKRILIFSTAESLWKIAHAEQIFMDGTFHASTKLFFQLYTIHVEFRGKISSMLAAFLPDKTESTYRRLYLIVNDILEQHGLELKPKCVIRTLQEEQSSVESAIQKLQASSGIQAKQRPRDVQRKNLKSALVQEAISLGELMDCVVDMFIKSRT